MCHARGRWPNRWRQVYYGLTRKAECHTDGGASSLSAPGLCVAFFTPHLRLRGTPTIGVPWDAHRHNFYSSEGGGVREHNLCPISGSKGPARRDLEGMPRQSLARLVKR